MKTKVSLLLLIVLATSLSSCRGWKTSKPPIHPNVNLDMQARFGPQTHTAQVPEDTVAWGRIAVYNDNPTRDEYGSKTSMFETGKASGYFVQNTPIKVSKELLLRGQEQYDIYCSMCHGYNGAGGGTVVQKGYYLASNLHENRYQKASYPDGKVFDVITNGYNNMWGYKKQISTDDRWAIVSYVRALQLSKRTPYSSLKSAQKENLKNGR